MYMDQIKYICLSVCTHRGIREAHGSILRFRVKKTTLLQMTVVFNQEMINCCTLKGVTK